MSSCSIASNTGLSHFDFSQQHGLSVPTKSHCSPLSGYTVSKVLESTPTGSLVIAENDAGERMLLQMHVKTSLSADAVTRELTFQSELQHPHLPRLGSFRETDTHTFIASSCIGDTLADVLTPHVGLHPNSVRAFMLQLCGALEYLHQHGIAHRNVKPENILVSKDHRTVNLVNFFLAESCDKLPANRRVGTFQYMAPELLASDGPLDLCAADVWSLGISMFVLLKGSFPWKSCALTDPDYVRFLNGHLDTAPWSDFEKPHLSLLRKMLRVSPSKRCSLEQVQHFIESNWCPVSLAKHKNHMRRVCSNRGDNCYSSPENTSPLPFAASPSQMG